MNALLKPGLYIVATPIGNLGDLSPRAADVRTSRAWCPALPSPDHPPAAGARTNDPWAKEAVTCGLQTWITNLRDEVRAFASLRRYKPGQVDERVLSVPPTKKIGETPLAKHEAYEPRPHPASAER